MRLHTVVDPSVIGRVATSIAGAGGIVSALDVAESRHDRLVVDVTCSATNSEHAEEIVAEIKGLEGINVHKVSDRTFLLHIGGKIEVHSKVPLRTRDDLSMAYTPGVGRVSMALYENPEDVPRLTVKGNSVAVVTDGSAVLGLGNIGPGAALPVMEGKAALFKRFADIDAWPICLDTQDTDRIVDVVEAIAPGFGGINLEDIAAPRCFEIEKRLRERLDIPVFHDDQHGTAIVVQAALTNALRCIERELADVRIVVAGRGRGRFGDRHAVARGRCRRGHRLGPRGLPLRGRRLAARGQGRAGQPYEPEARTRRPARRPLEGADVFIGVSAPDVLEAEWIKDMGEQPIVFALANPDPEIDPAEAMQHAAVVASGRSDYPNQINNVLAFPGVFRGLLDARASDVTIEMLLRAAEAIAMCVTDKELNASYIIPSVFDDKVPQRVAAAIRGLED